MKILGWIILLFGLVKAELKCNTPMEIALIVDTSDNLAASDYPDVKEFIKKIGDIFHVSPHASHVAVVLAGENVKIQIDFKSSSRGRKYFHKTVDGMQSLGGSRSLDRAFSAVKEKVFSEEMGVRNFIPHVAIVVSDGLHNEGAQNTLAAAAKELRDNRVSVYAISVGGNKFKYPDELRAMVEKESQIYQIDTYKDLITMAPNISADICQENTDRLRLCKVPVDIGFIVDSSGSINDEGYNNIKNFLKGISVYMGFKPGRTHVGIVLYSKVAEVALKFGRHPHLRKLFRSIQDLPHRKDLTRIDLGLQTANTSLFSKEGGMRENVTKIAILLTDGKQTVDNVSDLIPVRDAAEAIKQRNIPIFAIGIGRSVDRDELLEIVGSEDKLIEAKSFEQLQKEVDQIANVSCKVADIDECTTSEDGPCDKNATCTNAPESFICSCNEGYTGDGFKCADIDECAIPGYNPCDENALCINTPGSFECECKNGYTGDGFICDGPEIDFTKRVYDVIENETAIIEIVVTSGEIIIPVTIGVTTQPSTAGKNDFIAVSKSIIFQPGETGPKSIEIELIEDLLDEPTEEFTISLTSSSVVTLGPAASVNIIDNDEPIICGTANDDCHSFSTCIDTGPGTYKCTCNEGYSGDGKTCTDIDECIPPEGGPCDVNAICTNTPGSFFCVCNQGYTGNGFSCVGPVIDFTKRVYDIMENETAVIEIGVTSGEIFTPVTISVTTQQSTAGKDDFIAVRKSIPFQPGEKGPKSIEIELIDDLLDEPTEVFTISFSSSSVVTLGPPASVNIIDNDEPIICGTANDNCHRFATCTDTGPGTYSCSCNKGYSGDGKFCKEIIIDFTKRSYNVVENKKVLVGIGITSGEITTPVTIGVTTHPSTAGLDDFVAVRKKNITFLPGERGPKSIEIELVDDFVDEPTEAFTISLTSSAPMTLGEPAVVNIIDNDEPKICGTERDDCHEFATCTDIRPGAYKCSCKKGYSGNGKTCSDIDECALPGKGPCDNNAICTNILGSFSCECKSGYTGNGLSCADIDECQLSADGPCDKKAICINTQGSFTCACTKGYTGNGFECADVNECTLPVNSPCDENAICSNYPGSFVCNCINGYTGNGFKCVDIDECNLSGDSPCDTNAVCTNIPGSFVCTCNNGYAGNGFSCVDIDECKRPEGDRCNEKATCINTRGSFVCKCNEGYTGDGFECTDIDECALSSFVTCDKNAICTNIPGSFVCKCNEGYTGDGFICAGMRCALDVGFLVDSSSSMRDCNYEKQKEFVKDIARYLQVPSGMSQTSIVAYSEGATLMKKFNATNSMEGFEEVVDKLPLLGGRAYLDKAMYVAVSTMFTAENGMRNSVPKILIILNDGTQAAVSQSTDEISSMLRKNDIRVLVIGIGEADEQQLGQIVASPDDLIMVENFEDAKDKVAALSEEMCFNRETGNCSLVMRNVDVRIGGCVSQEPAKIGVCSGQCSPGSRFLRRKEFYELGCSCCQPATKVKKTVYLKCSMNSTQAFLIEEATSCACHSCA